MSTHAVLLCAALHAKEPGVSFHEIPANLDARGGWLKVISRKDRVPNSTSNNSVVCSLHFQASDFKENCKNRQLKPGVVPSIFPGYPSYMTKPPVTTRSEASIRKRQREPSSITSTNAVSLSGCTLDNGKAVTSSECEREPDTADASDPRISPDQLAERGDCND